MKIVLCTKDRNLRTSPRHGGKGVFFDSPRSAAQEVLSGVEAQDQIPKLPRALRIFFESISPEPKNHIQQERVLQEGIPVVWLTPFLIIF
jgi:hypothetical protein